MCGYPMQFKYKSAYGLRLHICTNEPEVCGFMTNEYGAGKLQIMKCDKCNDGYLIVKRSKDDYFLGCTNYKNDGSGCNNTISKAKYYEMMSFSSDDPIESMPRAVLREKRNHKEKIRIANANNVKYEKPKTINDPEQVEIYELSRTIINCIKNVSAEKYFNQSKISMILKGESFKDVSKIDFTLVPEFGKCANVADDRLNKVFEWLINNKFLHKTKALFPVLHLTEKTDDFLNHATKGQVKKLFEYVNSIDK